MPRSDAIDWLKAIGISLIVYGHVAHATTVSWTPPIYVKQLGVALFIFATGYTLARERRGVVEALVTRLFPIYLFGLAAAGFITILGLFSGAGLRSGSGLALSNYLPFLGGANVVFDNFPANPTTWYLGTYLHLLLVWAVLLRHVRVGVRMAAIAFLLEIPIRIALVAWAGPYVAYMFLTNWTTVFLLGLAYGARPASAPRGNALSYVVALVGGMALWAMVCVRLGFQETFPFMTLGGWSSMAGLASVSAAVSVLYMSSTLLTFGAARRVTAPGPIRFLARNSLIIFLGHMPAFFALNPILIDQGLGYWPRVGVHLLVCVGGFGVFSEVLLRLVKPKQLGRYLTMTLNGWLRPIDKISRPVSSFGN